MNMKTYYQTDISGLYIGPVQARQDPEDEENWLNPFGSFPDEPPAYGENQIPKRVGDSWVITPDWRGHVYWTADRSKHVITKVDIEPPADALDEDPGPTEAEIQAKAAEELKAEAQAWLTKSDVTVGRCYEDGIPVPPEWKAFRAHLRTIRSTGQGTIDQPPAPPITP